MGGVIARACQNVDSGCALRGGAFIQYRGGFSDKEHGDQLTAQRQMAEEDFYKTLDVSRGATDEELQKAYRGLARKYHPDLHPDDKDAKRKFQEVQRAFDVLSDSKKRELYDRYGSNFENIQPGGAPSGEPGWGGPQQGNFDDFDFSQIFGQQFGGADAGDIFGQFRTGGRAAGGRRRGRRKPQRGADLRYEHEIPFNTAISGGETTISIRRASGKVESIEVKIPPGIESGKTIRLREQGEPSPTGGSPGDLLLKIRVTDHPNFQRRGQNLHLKLPVTLAEAVLGAKVDVPTPEGTVTLSVPAGSSGGTRLRIRGHGVKNPKGKPGDLFAEIQIMLPEELDDEDREFIRKIDAKHPSDPRSKLQW